MPSVGCSGKPPHHPVTTASPATYALPVALELIELSGWTPRDGCVIDTCQIQQFDGNMEQKDIVFV